MVPNEDRVDTLLVLKHVKYLKIIMLFALPVFSIRKTDRSVMARSHLQVNQSRKSQARRFSRERAGRIDHVTSTKTP